MMIQRSFAVFTALLVTAPLLRAGEVDPYLPDDTQSVINLNVRQLLDSPLIKKNLLEMAQEALRGDDQVQDILKDLGLDPFKDIDRLLIASPAGGEKDRGLLIVHGRFDVAKFKAKAEQVAKDHSDHLKIQKVLGGKHQLYEVNIPDHDDPVFVAVASRDTLLLSPGKDYVVDALKRSKDPTKRGEPSKSLLKNKKFQSLLEKLDATQSLSLTAIANPEMKKAIDKTSASGDLKAMLDKIEALGGGLKITDEIKLELIATTKNTKDAKELRDSAKAALDAVVGVAALLVQNNDSPGAEVLVKFIKSLSVTNKGEAVVIKGRIDSDDIDDLLKKKK